MEMVILLVVSRALAAVVLLLGATLSIRLLTLYKGSLLEEPWLPIFVGIIFLALSQPLAALAPLVYPEDILALRVFRSLFNLIGGIFLFAGLYRALKIWQRLSRMAAVMLSVRDKED